MNAGELPEMDPYEEVAQQGQAHPLSPAYVPDPMELDEHVPVYVLEPEQPKYHAPSDDDIQVEDDDEDPEEDPSEEHEPEDDDEDPNKEHEPEDKDTKEPSEGSVRVLMRLNRSRRTRLLSHHHHLDTMERRSSPFPLPPTSPAYDQAPLVNLRVSYQAQVRRQESVNFYTQLLDARTDRRDIRLEIDVVRGQRTAYETELQEVHQ
nr:hypothetical protein [Tanacetum cinerariifolium]